MTALVRYEAARAALQAAHDVDEVKDIRDKAQAMALYAKQANDTALVEWATEIKVRAERKAGEMLAEMKINGARRDRADNLKEGPKSPDVTSGPTLDSLGISKNQAARWQKLAAVPESQFEQAVAAAKEVAGEVTTAALLRSTRTSDHDGPKSEPKPKAAPPADAKELADLKAGYADLKDRYETLGETARELQDKLEMYEATEPDEQQKKIAELQKLVQRKDGEIARQRGLISDLNNKNNALIRQVKTLQKKAA